MMNVDSFYRRTWVEISLDALAHNVKAFRHLLPEKIELMAVVKADGYGHGATEVAREALACGVSYLAVAFLDEAIELRRNGIMAPILVLGFTSEEGFQLALEHEVTLNVYRMDNLLKLAALIAGTHHKAKIHIKLDTGMGRLGLPNQEDVIALIEQALQLQGIEVEGLFTHFATADEADKSYSRAQFERFDRVVKYFAGKKIAFPYLHTGNSAAAINLPGLTYNMVRLGISMYGFYPSEEVGREKINLQPVMSFKTTIVMLKEVPKGTGISYGVIYHTQAEEEHIATLPVGYADGYSRMLTGRIQVLIGGQRVPVVGKICMDQCMVNVTGLAEVELDDEVVLFGRQGNEVILADELAQVLGTIHYEIVCMISRRVPRVYLRHGEVIKVVNYLQV